MARRSCTGIPGFHAQRHTRPAKDGSPRTYYQFWGQVTIHGKTYRTPRSADINKAYEAYQRLLEEHGLVRRTSRPTHPWLPEDHPEASSGDHSAAY